MICVSDEQKEAVLGIFNHFRWKFEENNPSKQDASTDTADLESADLPNKGFPPFIIEQYDTMNECPHCFCKPCITPENNRQMWWKNNSEPKSKRNRKLRKEIY